MENIALKKLEVSGLNARKASVDEVDDKALMATVEAQGVRQNLTVIQSKGGRLDVIATLSEMEKRRSIKLPCHLQCRICEECDWCEPE